MREAEAEDKTRLKNGDLKYSRVSNLKLKRGI
jgi:hypothetical protein